MTLPAVGAVLLCGAEQSCALCVAVAELVGTGVVVVVGSAVVDGVEDADGVIVGVTPDVSDCEAEGDAEAVKDGDDVAVSELVGVHVGELEGDAGIGAIASERYSVLEHARAIAVIAPDIVLYRMM